MKMKMKMQMGNPVKTPSLLISVSTLLCLSAATDTILPGQSLADVRTLISGGGAFALGFFSPHNSTNRYLGIWYNSINVQTAVWVANRRRPIADSSGNLTVTAAGALVLTDRSSGVVWSTTTDGTVVDDPVAQILATGNLVVRERRDESKVVWQSFDFPSDTLLPGMKLGWDLKRKLNRNLTAWRSQSDPSPGELCLAVDIRGDPQLTVFVGPARRWRSGPWNGLRFIGIPDMGSYSSVITFDFAANATDVYYSYSMTNPSVISRLVVNESGVNQRYVWVDSIGDWSMLWYAPNKPCDVYSACGAYEICDNNRSPKCSCLDGFEPKSAANWELGNGSGGCVRKTELVCPNGTDGFMRVENVLLPDTVAVTVDRGINLDECRDVCKRNCSCTGYANADIRDGGSRCIIWSSEMVDFSVGVNGGQDLFYVRLAAKDLDLMSTSGNSGTKVMIIYVTTISLVLGALLIACGVCYKWRKKIMRIRKGICSINSQWEDENTKTEEDLELPLFDLGTVMALTNDFADENKIGEGGFGPVYKGKLGEGQEIAIKRLSKSSIQGIDEFTNEVTLIAKLQHRNLVRLLGACVQAEERMLIYEYMHNKSLDTFLFDKVNGMNLDWTTRYNIIVGVARGLLYLHQDSRFRIIHRDLKASNILLDKEMNPKISDFGTARIFGGDETITKTRRVVGTFGYMSPEYVMDGIFSVKSDVFSFGVLVLEIVSGQKNKGVYLSEPNLYLLGNAWRLWKNDKGLELIDPAMCHSFSVKEAMRCIQVGLLCVQEKPEDRPTMASVVSILSSDSSPLSEPKQPGFVARMDGPEERSSREKQDSVVSVNGLTITMSMRR